jgi:hypothetical protein
MNKGYSRIIVLLTSSLIAFLLTGCATMNDALSARGTGETRTYNASFEKVWSVMPSVISSLELEYVRDDKNERYILAHSGVTLSSYGVNVAIFIDPVSESKTKVEVVSKRVQPLNTVAPDYTEPILTGISSKLSE